MTQRLIKGHFVIIPSMQVVDDETDDPPIELRLEPRVIQDDGHSLAELAGAWPGMFAEQKESFAKAQADAIKLGEIQKEKPPPRAVRRASAAKKGQPRKAAAVKKKT